VRRLGRNFLGAARPPSVAPRPNDAAAVVGQCRRRRRSGCDEVPRSRVLVWPPAGMTSSSTSVRLTGIWRRAMPWLVGPAALLIQGRLSELTSPNLCPGLLDLISILVLRAQPDLTVGTLFTTLHAFFVVIGLAAVVALARRAACSLAVATATGLAIGLSPLFPQTLAPPWEASAFAACALGACFLASKKPSIVLCAAGAWFAAAVFVPAFTIPAAIGAGVTFVTALPQRSRTWRLVVGTAVTLVCVLSAVLVFLRSGTLEAGGLPVSSWRALVSCALPMWRPMGWTGLLGRVFGPFALALAALGLFVVAQRTSWRRAVAIAAIALVAIAAAGSTATSPLVALSPVLVGTWVLVAVGLQQIVALAQRPVGRVAAALVIVLLPTLQVSRLRADERDDRVRPLGHEATTLGQVIAILNVVPSDATFAEEDSSMDILLRAAVFGGRRKGKPFVVVPRRREVMAQALDRGPVFAFPRGQQDLSLRGFAIEPVTRIGRSREGAADTIEGLTAVTGIRSCQVIGDSWIDLDAIGASGRIALSGDSEAAYGPIVLYLGGPTDGEPRADGWPIRSTRGFRWASFDRQTDANRERLQAEARAVGLSEHPVFAAPFVTRLTLHRTPRAPLTLAVLLGASLPVGIGKGEYAGPGAAHLTICDAPPVRLELFNPKGRAGLGWIW
jgi:hypothetical protein